MFGHGASVVDGTLHATPRSQTHESRSEGDQDAETLGASVNKGQKRRGRKRSIGATAPEPMVRKEYMIVRSGF